MTLLRLSPTDFIGAVTTHLLSETEGQIVPFILGKVCWIIEQGLIVDGTDPKFAEYAAKLRLDLLTETLASKIQNLPAAKQSEKTCLMDFLIRLLPA